MEGKGLLLRDDEALWDVALRCIGIQLPDEYVLRFMRLLDKAKEVGLGKITLDDSVDIERGARQELERRMKEKED